MLQQVKQQLENDFNKELIDGIFECYQLAYDKYYRGDYRPSSLQCGRFAEVALRMLQEKTTGTYTPLGQQLPNFVNEVRRLEQKPKTLFHESIRIQIPRTLQIIYDVRNKRDIGHVGGDVDANFSDATISLVACSWVLTEFLRLYYTSDINTAQKLVNSIVKLKIPIIQDFNGFLKILNPKLSLPQKILALLYYRVSDGALIDELNQWLHNKVTKNHMDITLNRLEYDKAFIHRENNRCFITDTGMRYVQEYVPFQI
jgi:HEPN domain-containing protein